MVRSSTDGDDAEELDYSNAPSPDYTVEDLVKIITVKNPGIDGGNKAAYQILINQVAEKIRELENGYKKISKKLPAKLDDIFEPTIKIKLGINKIAAFCDLGASVSTISKTLFDRLNLGYFMVTELKLHLADSTYKQAVGIKENIVVKVKYCLAPEDPLAPIILGRPFLRTVKPLINLHEGNVRFELPSRAPFIVHFPRKKSKANGEKLITLKVNYFGVGVPIAKKS
jgi:hypothetical protein